MSARLSTRGGGLSGETELIDHFTRLDQAQLPSGDRLDASRVVLEGLYLLNEFLVPLFEPSDLSMKFSPGLAHLIDPDETSVPAHGEDGDQHHQHGDKDESPFASGPGLGELLLSAGDNPSRPHPYSVAA